MPDGKAAVGVAGTGAVGVAGTGAVGVIGTGAVGVIGLGAIGLPIARHLLAAGRAVHGFRRSGAAALAAAGGVAAASPRAVAESCDVVLTCLPDAAALAEVADAIAAAGRAVTVVDLSTLHPDAKAAAAAVLARAGAGLMDCPLSGTPPMVEARQAVLFASGTEADWARAGGVLRDVSEKVFFLGPFGTGTRMKFCANLLVSAHILAAAEALLLGRKAGLDPALVATALAEGAGSSLQFKVRAPMMAAGDYATTLAPNTMLAKDLSLIAGFAKELGCTAPLLEACAAWFDRAAHGSLAERDVATIHELLAAASGLPPRGVPGPIEEAA